MGPQTTRSRDPYLGCPMEGLGLPLEAEADRSVWVVSFFGGEGGRAAFPSPLPKDLDIGFVVERAAKNAQGHGAP